MNDILWETSKERGKAGMNFLGGGGNHLGVSGLSCSMQDLSLWHVGSRAHSSVVARQGPSCPKACGILVPQPGNKPASPALKGSFLTTGPPGKSLYLFSSVLYIGEREQ